MFTTLSAAIIAYAVALETEAAAEPARAALSLALEDARAAAVRRDDGYRARMLRTWLCRISVLAETRPSAEELRRWAEEEGELEREGRAVIAARASAFQIAVTPEGGIGAFRREAEA